MKDVLTAPDGAHADAHTIAAQSPGNERQFEATALIEGEPVVLWRFGGLVFNPRHFIHFESYEDGTARIFFSHNRSFDLDVEGRLAVMDFFTSRYEDLLSLEEAPRATSSLAAPPPPQK